MNCNCITINTDASFYSEEKVGGYAFYIICDHFKIQKAGAFKNKVKDSTEAEIKAIANALQMLLNQKNLPTTKHLIINTDSKWAINTIKKQQGTLGKEVYKIWQKLIVKIGSKNNCFRHVKSHSGIQDSRSYVNEWCDANAKMYARNEFLKIKTIKNKAKNEVLKNH